MSILIRPIKTEEIPLLADFLYLAIFQRDENNLLPKSIIFQPEINIYIDSFGKKDDHCFVAQQDGRIVGAVWTRVLSGNPKGFGNIDSQTPEFAISVEKAFRGQSIGAMLMKHMLAHLKQMGYKQTSLAVQKDNYAYKMYQRAGFETIGETTEEYIMLKKF